MESNVGSGSKPSGSPPFLTSLRVDDVQSFLEGYRFYVDYAAARGKDRNVLPACLCVSEAIKTSLQLRDRHIFDSDDTFVRHLRSLAQFDDLDKVLNAFDNVRMRLNISDVHDRLADYDLRFHRAYKRSLSVGLKEKPPQPVGEFSWFIF